MALVYAARFPTKVRKLVLAGTSVHITSGSSALSMLADKIPPIVFHELVRLGDGLVPGRKVLKFWGPESITAEDIQQLLQTEEPIDSADFRKLETCSAPGTLGQSTCQELFFLKWWRSFISATK